MGKLSFVIGLLTLFFLVFLILYARKNELANPGELGFLTYTAQGETGGGTFPGPLGSLCLMNGLLAIAGTICSATARKEVPFLDGYATAGIIINLFVLVITFGLFLVGATL